MAGAHEKPLKTLISVNVWLCSGDVAKTSAFVGFLSNKAES
jgi:hypothetical protein